MTIRRKLIGAIGGLFNMTEKAFFHSIHDFFFSIMIRIFNLEVVKESKDYVTNLQYIYMRPHNYVLANSQKCEISASGKFTSNMCYLLFAHFLTLFFTSYCLDHGCDGKVSLKSGEDRIKFFL